MITDNLTFYVNDLDEAIDWYRRELCLSPSTDSENERATFDSDSVRLTLVSVHAARASQDPQASSVLSVLPIHLRHRMLNLRELC